MRETIAAAFALIVLAAPAARAQAVQGTWYDLRPPQPASEKYVDPMKTGRLVFVPKGAPATGAKLPEFVFPAKAQKTAGNIVIKFCPPETIPPAAREDQGPGYWAANPSGNGWVWVPFPSRYPQYLSPPAYPANPPPRPKLTCSL